MARELKRCDAIAVLATAGSGKTVQTQLFAARCGWPVAWLTLDAADCSGARLLSYLALALTGMTQEPQGLLRRTSTSGLTLAESAAMLAELLEDEPCLIVFDDCELITGSTEAVSVLKAFLDYLPCSARAVLLSREELDPPLARLILEGRMARVVDTDLALEVDEARRLFAQADEDPDLVTDEDLERLVDWTRGWVGGVAFAARTRAIVPPDQGTVISAPDLAAYVHHEIFDRLTSDEQRFLIRTSVLDEVTPRAAVALCGPEGQALWRAIAARHLPFTATPDRTLLYHPYFRQFLLEQLELGQPELLPELQQRHALFMNDRGLHEEATELLLRAGDLDGAVAVAERALPQLFARADWPLIIRWCEQLGQTRVDASVPLRAAMIRSMTGVRRVQEARELVRRLDREDGLRAVAEWDPGGVAQAIAWPFQLVPAEGLALLNQYYTTDYRADGVRYELEVVSSDQPSLPPAGTEWCEVERFVSWGLLLQGRLSDLLRMLPSESDWSVRTYYGSPHPLFGLAWRGEAARARDLWERVPLELRQRAHQDHWHHLESWLCLLEGEPEKAQRAAESAVAYSRRTHYEWEPFFNVAVARAVLALGEVDQAASLLKESVTRLNASGQLAYAEWAETFLGLALLRGGAPEAAEPVLRGCVERMTRASRVLMLPLAGVYLSDAARQLGDDEAARQAAEIAYDASVAMGSFFPLQQALRELPNVLPRQIQQDAFGSRWLRVFPTHPKARARVIQAIGPGETVTLDLQTFGPATTLMVNGIPAQPRRLKVFELVAYLAIHPEGVARERLQDDLFPDSDQRRAGNHLRQIVHQLRRASGVPLIRTDDGRTRWPPYVRVDTSDLRFERLLAEANAASGTDRLDRLVRALTVVEGSYLQDSDLEWVDTRRYELEVMLVEARLEAARLAFELDELEQAHAFASDVIKLDTYAEPAYRILMQLELALGRPNGAMRIFQRLRDALVDLGTEPDTSTLTLLRDLRRAGV